MPISNEEAREMRRKLESGEISPKSLSIEPMDDKNVALAVVRQLHSIYAIQFHLWKYAKILISIIVNRPREFKHFFKDEKVFREVIAKTLPEHAEVLISIVNNPEGLKHLAEEKLTQNIECREKFKDLVENRDKFKHLVKNSTALCVIAEYFPKHTETLIGKVLNDPEEFRRIIESTNNLCKITEQFPGCSEALIDKVINNPEEFRRLIKSIDDLCKIAEQFPGCSEALIDKVINNPEEFRLLIKSTDHLCKIAEQFPGCSEALIDKVTKEPEEFHRIVTNIVELYKAAEQFPEHAKVLMVLGEKINIIKEIWKGKLELRQISLALRADKEIVLAAAKKNGVAVLQHAAPNLRGDYEIMLAAVRNIHRNYELHKTAEQFPEYIEALINIIINDSEEFKRLIKNTDDLCKTAEQFTEHAKILIDKVINDPEELKRLIKNTDDLYKITEQFPNHYGALINKVLKNPEEFRRLIKNANDLCRAAEQFPEHAKTLIYKVINDLEEFKRLIESTDDLCKTAEQFTEYAEDLINIILKRSKEFKRLVKNNLALGKIAKQFPGYAILEKKSVNEAFTDILVKNKESSEVIQGLKLGKIYPESISSELMDDKNVALAVVRQLNSIYAIQFHLSKHAKKLIRVIVNNPREFERFFKDLAVLRRSIVEMLPEHAETLISIINNSEVLKHLTVAPEIFKHFLADRFKHLVKNNTDLCVTAEYFPQHSKTLIDKVINDPEEFKRLIKSTDDLCKIAEQFPGHDDILKKKSVGEAVEAILERKSYSEVRRNARLLAQGNKGGNTLCLLSQISKDSLLKIATLTGNPTTHNEEQSAKIALAHFSNPSH